jgi:hypothetical protein
MGKMLVLAIGLQESYCAISAQKSGTVGKSESPVGGNPRNKTPWDRTKSHLKTF